MSLIYTFMLELTKGPKCYGSMYVPIYGTFWCFYFQGKMITPKTYHRIVNCDCHGEDVSERLMAGIHPER